MEPYAGLAVPRRAVVPAVARGTAHPLYVYYAALGGMGVTLDELFALVDATADSGVMFGEAGIEQRRPMQQGQTYEVGGEILSIVRKSGKRAGTFDILAFRLDVSDADGVVGTSYNSFVFPRKE